MFVLAFIPLSLILTKAKAAHEFSESKGKNRVWYRNVCFVSNGERKIMKSVGIELSDGKLIKSLQDVES